MYLWAFHIACRGTSQYTDSKTCLRNTCPRISRHYSMCTVHIQHPSVGTVPEIVC